MPKKAIEIKQFNKGMATNIDATDPQIDVPVYTKGLETHNSIGSLTGSPVDEDILDNLGIQTAIPFILYRTDTMFAISSTGMFYFISGLYDTPFYKEYDKDSTQIELPNDPGVGI